MKNWLLLTAIVLIASNSYSQNNKDSATIKKRPDCCPCAKGPRPLHKRKPLPKPKCDTCINLKPSINLLTLNFKRYEISNNQRPCDSIKKKEDESSLIKEGFKTIVFSAIYDVLKWGVLKAFALGTDNIPSVKDLLKDAADVLGAGKGSGSDTRNLDAINKAEQKISRDIENLSKQIGQLKADRTPNYPLLQNAKLETRLNKVESVLKRVADEMEKRAAGTNTELLNNKLANRKISDINDQMQELNGEIKLLILALIPLFILLAKAAMNKRK